MKCTAKSKRSGVQCRNWAVKGKDKCRMHGGATPVKHGLDSKYGPPPALAAKIAEFENDPKVLDHKHIGAHVYVLLMGALHDRSELDASDAEELLPLLERLRRVATDYHRLALDSRFVDLVEAQAFIGRIVQAVLRHVPEEKRRDAIRDAEQLIGDSPVADAAASVH